MRLVAYVSYVKDSGWIFSKRVKKEIEVTLCEVSPEDLARSPSREPRFSGFDLQKRAAGMPWDRTKLVLRYDRGENTLLKSVELEASLDELQELVVTVKTVE